MIVDVNVLLYAVDELNRYHKDARAWLEDALNGDTRVGFPWHSLVGFTRIATHPRIFTKPMSARTAWGYVEDWLSQDVAWIPQPTDNHQRILGRLVVEQHLTANLVPDAHLAALAIEHGVGVCSFDTDLARFPEITWINPRTS